MIVALEYRQAIISAVLDNNREEFKSLLANDELDDEQRWSFLNEALQYVEPVEEADEGDKDQEQSYCVFELAIKENNITMVEAIFATPGLNQERILVLLGQLVAEHCTILSEAANEGFIDMVALLVNQTKTLSNFERLKILNHTLKDINECNFCYRKDSDSNNHDDDLRKIRLYNDIIQIILQSCNDL